MFWRVSFRFGVREAKLSRNQSRSQAPKQMLSGFSGNQIWKIPSASTPPKKPAPGLEPSFRAVIFPFIQSESRAFRLRLPSLASFFCCFISFPRNSRTFFLALFQLHQHQPTSSSCRELVFQVVFNLAFLGQNCTSRLSPRKLNVIRGIAWLGSWGKTVGALKEVATGFTEILILAAVWTRQPLWISAKLVEFEEGRVNFWSTNTSLFLKYL